MVQRKGIISTIRHQPSQYHLFCVRLRKVQEGQCRRFLPCSWSLPSFLLNLTFFLSSSLLSAVIGSFFNSSSDVSADRPAGTYKEGVLVIGV